MRHTVILGGRLAWRAARLDAARAGTHGVAHATLAGVAARLAGGFRRPADGETLLEAVRAALAGGGLPELGPIAELAGTARAVLASLRAAWNADLDLARMARVAPRIAELAEIEARVASALPAPSLLPRALARAARARVDHARAVLGPVEVRGVVHLEPLWRPLVRDLASRVRLRWHAAGEGAPPGWLAGCAAEWVRAAGCEPRIETVSCASPRHEALEALRWARSLLASGRARPAEIAIAAAAPEPWDAHLLALGATADVPLHFAHGRPALATPEGQWCAALAAIVVHGLSHARVRRLLALARGRSPALEGLPERWDRHLAPEAPLETPGHWRRALESAAARGECDPRPWLLPLVEGLGAGPERRLETARGHLSGAAAALWEAALRRGPAEALESTLEGLRVPDPTEPGAAVAWAPAAEIAAAPRPCTWLLGLTSRSWPRAPADDPLLPPHVIDPRRLLDLPLPALDRRRFDAIAAGTARTLVLSLARRDAEGRPLAPSPLLGRAPSPTHLRRARVPEHAAGEGDRLLARPAEFARRPLARSAAACWRNRRASRLTAHDGLVRAGHPAIEAALARVHSATSLRRLLRDPLGFVWRYALGWREPVESEPPLTLDALAFGALVHEILERAVASLEGARGGLGSAGRARLAAAVTAAVRAAGEDWELRARVPPELVWRRQLAQAGELALAALILEEPALPGQRSWVEVPFGAGCEERRARIEPPWPAGTPVTIPGTGISVAGVIDRLDLSGDGRAARVTDYKTGRPPADARGAAMVLDGGAELQRCIYAFAVRALLPGVERIESRLLFVAGPRVHPLPDPEAALATLAHHVGAAARSLRDGLALPGPDTERPHPFNELALALPAAPGSWYFPRKAPERDRRLAEHVALWGLA